MHDRLQALLAARHETEAELARIAREESYVSQQVREAAEQVRYYEGLLVNLRRDWGKPAALADLVRRLS
ncbi:MAG TPA: hypothetical protein VEY07_00250 [Thermoplasmata archaeon]|nr:hypothetical protein [Thermoplasmata archaeon]